jgi:hypothetical protein
MSRPVSTQGEECICNYNPETTDGPEEHCPVHGRLYSFWVERSDWLGQKVEKIRVLHSATHRAVAYDAGEPTYTTRCVACGGAVPCPTMQLIEEGA